MKSDGIEVLWAWNVFEFKFQVLEAGSLVSSLLVVVMEFSNVHWEHIEVWLIFVDWVLASWP